MGDMGDMGMQSNRKHKQHQDDFDCSLCMAIPMHLVSSLLRAEREAGPRMTHLEFAAWLGATPKSNQR